MKLRTLRVNKNDRSIKILPEDLTIRSFNGEQFSIPEYLVAEMKLCDIPEEIYIYPYDYFDDCGKAKSNHVPLIFTKRSDTEAWVCFPEQERMDDWYPKLGGVLYPKLKRDLILKQAAFTPDVYCFDEQQPGLINMEYSIIVSGNTVKDVIVEAVEFDRRIESALYNVLPVIERIFKAKLDIA